MHVHTAEVHNFAVQTALSQVSLFWKHEGGRGMFDDKKSEEAQQCLVVSMLPAPEYE